MLRFLSKTFLKMLFAFTLFFAGTAVSTVAAENASVPAIVVIQALPGTTVFQESNGAKMRIGSVPEDGLLILEDTLYAGTYRLVFEHDDAAEAAVLDDVVLKAGSAKKLVPTFKMKKGELVVTCLPVETEIFINGKRVASGSIVSGEYDIGSELTVEARSTVYGVETKRVKLEKGKTARVAFDLRGRIPMNIPDGKIVLSDVALVLASQPAAVIKVDGALVELSKNGAIEMLQPGVRRVEISFPQGDELIPVWRGAFKAVSAVIEDSNEPSELLDWDILESNRAAAESAAAGVMDDRKENSVPAPVVPVKKENVVPVGVVEMALVGQRAVLNFTKGAEVLVVGGAYYLKRIGKPDVLIRISTVAGTSATAAIMNPPAAGAELVEAEGFSLELAGVAAEAPAVPETAPKPVSVEN